MLNLQFSLWPVIFNERVGKMKKYFVVLVLIVLVMGCESEQKKGFENREVPNGTGNSYGNMINHGFVVSRTTF